LPCGGIVGGEHLSPSKALPRENSALGETIFRSALQGVFLFVHSQGIHDDGYNSCQFVGIEEFSF